LFCFEAKNSIVKKGERINSLLYNLKLLSYTPLYTENNNQNTSLCLSTSSLLEYSFWAAGFIQYKSFFSIQYYMSQYTKTKLKKPVEFTHKLTIYKILLNDWKMYHSMFVSWRPGKTSFFFGNLYPFVNARQNQV
jgi:hypothetical protein